MVDMDAALQKAQARKERVEKALSPCPPIDRQETQDISKHHGRDYLCRPVLIVVVYRATHKWPGQMKLQPSHLLQRNRKQWQIQAKDC